MSKYSNILKNNLITASSIWHDAVRIKEQWPLVHNITNYVVMEFNANILLALGASPIMAHAPEEVEEMCLDALNRNESCGAHFREEYQTEDGEAKRNDSEYSYVSVWKYEGQNNTPQLYKESLEFKDVQLSTRSYK